MNPLPSPSSPEWQSLSERIHALEPKGLIALTYGALQRPRLESLFQKVTRATAAGRKREELVASVVAHARANEDALHRLAGELDQASRPQRSLVGSTPPAEAAARLGSLEALSLQREGARLLWALVRDERREVHGLVARILAAYFAEMDRRARLAEAAERAGATEDLAELEKRLQSLERGARDTTDALRRAEGERAALIAALGRKEAALREAADQRRALERKVAASKSEPEPGRADRVEPEPEPVQQLAALREDNSRLASRASKLESRVESLEATLAETERKLAAAEGGTRAAERRTQETEDAARKQAERSASEHARLEAALAESERRLAAATAPAAREPAAGPARVAVLVDVANLAGAARLVHHGRKVDYIGLLARLVGDRRLMAARAFAIDSGDPGFQAFAASLRNAGYQVWSKRPKTYDDGTVKADWDVGVAMEAVRLAPDCEVVILCSGDGDFVPLVRLLKAWGKRVELASFPERTHADLPREVDRHHTLDAGDTL